jgi:hypothetical protein
MQTLAFRISAVAACLLALAHCAVAAPPAAAPPAAQAPPAAAPPAAAAPPSVEEVREFDVFVKDKPAGKSTLRITDTADGTTQVATDVKVELNYLVYVYRYQFRGRETWRNGRLALAENRATDDGHEFVARVQAGSRGARIEANGQARSAPAVDLTTNYWRGPDLTGGQKFSFMNADRGTLHAVRVERLGPEQVAVGRQKIACTHLRVSGETKAELWVDSLNRLVRQKTVEDGYPTELRLTRITRAASRTADRRSPRR